MVGVFPAEKLFELHDTYGLPFEITLGMLKEKRFIIDANKFIDVCVNHGWNRDRTTERVMAGIADVYPSGRDEFVRWADGS